MLHIPKQGSVVAIYISEPLVEGPMPMGGHKVFSPAILANRAEVVKGMGIKGDRWFGVNALQRQDGVMVLNDHARNITFFEQELFSEVQNLGFDIQPNDIRRNVLVRNFPLNDLVGKDFTVGDVKFRGSRLSHGCDRIEEILKLDGINKALYMRGGIRAEILTDGIIVVGDKLCCC